MCVNRCQTMTITNIKCTKCKVQLLGRIKDITKRGRWNKINSSLIVTKNCAFGLEYSTKHANAMKWNDAWWWTFVLFRFGYICKVRLNTLPDFRITRKTQHNLRIWNRKKVGNLWFNLGFFYHRNYLEFPLTWYKISSKTKYWSSFVAVNWISLNTNLSTMRSVCRTTFFNFSQWGKFCQNWTNDL